MASNSHERFLQDIDQRMPNLSPRMAAYVAEYRRLINSSNTFVNTPELDVLWFDMSQSERDELNEINKSK